MKLASFSIAARRQGSVSKYGGRNKWKDGGYLGQCVSLINQYCWRVLGVPAGAWGHAIAWGYTTNTNVLKYFKQVSGKPRSGDILVYGSSFGGGFGHIEIYLGAGLSLYQNRTWNGRVGVGRRLSGYYRILRRKASAKPVSKSKKRYITVRSGWGLSSVAKAAGYKDYGYVSRWAAIAKLNGSKDWRVFNRDLKVNQKVRVK